jgi:hypothetical protein
MRHLGSNGLRSHHRARSVDVIEFPLQLEGES